MFKKIILSPLGELTQDTRTFGDRVRFRIIYGGKLQPAATTRASTTITDVVDPGLARVRVFNNGTYDVPTRTITWHVKYPLPARGAYVEFDAVVRAKGKISNQAVANITGHRPVKTNAVSIAVGDAPPTGWISFSHDARKGDAPHRYMKDETTMGTTVRFDLPGVFVHTETVGGVTYQRLTLPGCAWTTETGKPELPLLGEMIEVPFNVDFSPEIVKSETMRLEGYNLYPAQPPRIEIGSPPPPFTIDKATYLNNADYPPQPVTIARGDIAVIRGHRVLFLKVNPIQYNPATRTVTVYTTIEVRLNFNRPAQIKGVNRRVQSLAFEEMLQASLLNYKDHARFQGEGGDGSNPEIPACDYLIITHDAFYNDQDPNNPVMRFANWKRRKGYRTLVVKVGTIQGGNTAASIQAYIRKAYNTWNPPPSYILLVGDSDLVRSVQGTTGQPIIETDLYYVTVDGTDYFPDIYIGRISADSIQQVTDIVDKLLTYEQNPPVTPAQAGFYSNVSLVGQFADNDQRVPMDVDGREDRPWIGNLETIRQFLQGQGYTAERIYNTDSGFPGDPNAQKPLKFNDTTDLPNDLKSPNYGWNGSTNDITNAIDQGRFLMTYRAHGWWGGWADPAFSLSDVANLTQNNLTPLFISITCQTGWFDNETDDDTHGGHGANDDSLAEVLIRRPRAGAIAVVGMTRNSSTGYNDFLVFGIYKAIWPNFAPNPPWSGYPTIPVGTQVRLLRFGQIVNFSKMFMAQAYSPDDTRLNEFEMQQLFGDPEMPIWTQPPADLKVELPPGIGATGLQEFVVFVTTNNQPVQNATVVLTRANAIVQMRQTLTNGTARFSLTSVGSGDLEVTVTALCYRPYLGTLQVTTMGAELNLVNPLDGPENQIITVGGQGFQASETIDIYFGKSGPTTTTADATGKFGQGIPAVNITVPSGYVHGLANVRAYGHSSHRHAVRIFQVRDKNPVDLWTYDQWDPSTWSLHPGDNPTWDSPDIQLYDTNGNPVDSNNLTLGKDYTVKVNVRNRAAFAAQGAKVTFDWENYGAGGPWQNWDTATVDVPANPLGLAVAQANFKPQATGHLCIQVNLEHVEDIGPINNTGQENLHVGYSSSPTDICFTVWNRTKEPAPVHLEVRQLIKPDDTKVRLWASWVKHPEPQILQPGEAAQASVTVDPDKADAGHGATAEFAVTAFIGKTMIGGVNLKITKK